MMIYKHILKTH